MPTHMPLTPANRSQDNHGSNSGKKSRMTSWLSMNIMLMQPEKGGTANIKQDTTNKGFFRGRRFS